MLEKIQEELQAMKVELEADPLRCGLDYFNEKISQIQGYKERTSNILNEAIANRLMAQQALENEQFKYDCAFAKLIATDQDIVVLKSADKRDAATKIKLISEYNNVLALKKTFIEQDILFKEVHNKYEFLKDSAEYLFKQLSVCQMLVQFDSSLLGKKVLKTK